jgi:hypothetical protein
MSGLCVSKPEGLTKTIQGLCAPVQPAARRKPEGLTEISRRLSGAVPPDSNRNKSAPRRDARTLRCVTVGVDSKVPPTNLPTYQPTNLFLGAQR